MKKEMRKQQQSASYPEGTLNIVRHESSSAIRQTGFRARPRAGRSVIRVNPNRAFDATLIARQRRDLRPCLRDLALSGAREKVYPSQGGSARNRDRERNARRHRTETIARNPFGPRLRRRRE